MNSIVTRIMEGNDTDGDGVISAEEMKAMDPNRSSMVKMADSNGDGNVTRAEMTKAMSSRMGSGGRPGGGGGFGGGAGGGGPRQ